MAPNALFGELFKLSLSYDIFKEHYRLFSDTLESYLF